MADGVEADVVGDELLLEPAQMEVAAVAQEFGAMGFIADVKGIAAQEVEDICEDVARSIGDAGRNDGRGTQEADALEAGEGLVRGGEEGAEAEGEEVGGVARSGEDVAGDLEVAVSDLDADFGFEELGV